MLKFTQVSHIIHFKPHHDRNEPMNCANVKFNDKPRRKNTITELSTSSLMDEMSLLCNLLLNFVTETIMQYTVTIVRTMS